MNDQGRNFESSLIAEFCCLTKVKKLQTSPYRPKTNSTLINVIMILPEKAEKNWKEHIITLVCAYNCMTSNATGHSPYYLMYVRHLVLSIDVEFAVQTPSWSVTTTHGYVQKLQKILEWAYRKAQEINEKECQHNKGNYDRIICCTKLYLGHLVLAWQKAL